MNRTKLAVAVVCSLLLSALAPPPRAQATPSAGPEAGVRMSLADCLRIGLEYNLDLYLVRQNQSIAREQIIVNGAVFDPILGAGASYAKSTANETIEDLAGGGSEDTTANSDTLAANVGLQQTLKYGGLYSVTLRGASPAGSGQSVDRNTGFLNEYDFSGQNFVLGLHYEMPLLRGFGKEVNTVNVLLAKSDLEITKEQLRGQAQTTAKAIEDAYWDLSALQEAVRVAKESLKLAQDLYDLNKKKVEVGTLAPIEITQAEAGVASREEGVIVAETAVLNAEDRLRRLLAVPKDDAAWGQRIILTDKPNYRDVSVDVEAAIATAMEQRPELVAARRTVSNGELIERVTQNGVRHSLNLSADLSPKQGTQDVRAGVLFPPGFPGSDSRTDSKGRDWAVGLTYSYPIGNRAAKSNYAIAKINREKNEISLASLEQDVRVDVRAAARAVESGVQRVAAARSSTALQRKTLEAEQKKFENGMSTSFEVLRIQNDLSSAQVAQIRAVLDYIKSLADLERAKGTLLEARGLTLDESAGK